MRPRRRSLAGTAVVCAALVGLALAVAGCGGGANDPAVAQAPSTTNQSNQTGSGANNSRSGSPAAYSACMRSHGVPKFPDPNSKGELQLQAGPGTGIDPDSATFKAAERTCRKLAPTGPPVSPAQRAKMQAQALKFSACMRSHGVPKFPDPTFSGGRASLRLDRSLGTDPNSPVFQAAQKACQKLLPGRPTSAKGGPGGGKGATTGSGQ